MPFAVFDMRFAEQNGNFYAKESPVFVAKLEQYFGIPARNFVWIDDNPNILEKVKSFGSQSIQVTDENRLKDILEYLEEKEYIK